MFDNGNFSSNFTGNTNISRAVEYELDLELMTATNTWEFIRTPYFHINGSVQRLENGNTLVNFGNLSLLDRGAVITEVTPSNEIVFEFELDPPSEDNGSSNIYCANKFDWFFDRSIVGCNNTNACNFNINLINNEMYCEFPGDSCELFISGELVSGIIDENCDCISNNSSVVEITGVKKLLHRFDLLGKGNPEKLFQFHIYDDGSVEKKYLIK